MVYKAGAAIMAQFQITSPDGQAFEITAPDNATDAEVMAYAQKNFAQQPVQPQQQRNADYQAMKDYARQETYANPASAVGAYALNAMQAIPFADEAMSAGIAALGMGRGNNYGERHDNLQMANQAVREAGKQNYPDQTALGNAGAGLATMAVPLPAGGLKTALGTGAATGAAYGAGDADARLTGDAALEARKGNALTSGGTGLSLGGLGHGVGKAAEYTGSEAPRVVQELAKKAESMGIPLTADQISNTTVAQNLGKILRGTPFSGRAGLEETQRKAYAKEIGRLIGSKVDDLTPGSITAAHQAAGNAIGGINRANKLVVDNELLTGLADFGDETGKLYKNLPQGAAITNQIDNILDSAKNGVVPGERYQVVRTRLREMGSNPEYAYGTSKLGSMLDDAFAKGLPDDATRGALSEARRQYRTSEILAKPLAGSTANAGDISPNAVFSRLATESPDEIMRGASELSDVARVGKQFLQFPSGSDTQSKMMLAQILGLGGGFAGGTAVGIDPATMAQMLIAGATVGRGVNAASGSKAARDFALYGSKKGAATAEALARYLRSGAIPAATTGGEQ